MQASSIVYFHVSEIATLANKTHFHQKIRLLVALFFTTIYTVCSKPWCLTLFDKPFLEYIIMNFLVVS